MLLWQVIVKKYNLLGNNQIYDFFKGYKKYKENYIKQRKPVVYFAGFPEHGNMGDQAIAAAMASFVGKNFPEYYIHTIPLSGIIGNLLRIKRHIKKEDIFALIGGGNMGDVYFDEEEARRIIIENFPHNKIIIFPQTIDYKDKSPEGELKKSIKIYKKHKNLYIFAREMFSYNLMKLYYPENNVALCPDIVFSFDVNKLIKEKRETDKILLCIRKDKESAMPLDICTAISKMADKYKEKVIYTDTVLSGMPYIEKEDIRRTMVYRKLKEFADAGIVITDRLHGMIFAVICHTPCIVIGNYNHKITSCYETWLSDTNYIHMLSEGEDLMEIVKKLKQEFPCTYKNWQECFDGICKAWRK